MNIKRFTAVIVPILLFMFMTEIPDIANANPIRLGWVPTMPDTSIPRITIESPMQNETYESINIGLNFTVFMPDSWFSNDPSGQAPTGHYCNGQVKSAQIYLDGNQIKDICISNSSYLPYSSEIPLNRSVSLFENLAVPEGHHVLAIHVKAESYHMPPENWDVKTHNGVIITECYPVAADSASIAFNVYAQNSSPSPSLTPLFNTLSSPSPSPSVPEFPLTAIAITFLTVTVLVGIFSRRKQLR